MATNSTAAVASSAAPTSIPSSETPTPSLTPSSATPPVSSSDLPFSSSVNLSTPPPSSATPTPTPSSEAPPSSAAATSVVTASQPPPSTRVITSFVTPSATAPGETPTPSVILITVTNNTPITATQGTDASSTNPSDASATTNSTALASLNNKDGSGGLGTGGKTAIAVVVPVVVVALLVLAGIILWRKRKQRKNAEEARRKEVEEYGFNPNHDPTLPAVGMASEMAEDQSGYRGWGNTTTSSNRKASTTLNSGMTYSDSNSNPGGYQSPSSPTAGGSDGHSVDPLVNGRRETLDSEGIGALGAAPVAGQNQTGVHRGPSNASSSYSAAGHSDSSDNYPLPMNNPQDYYDNNAYYAPNPYDNGGYGGGGQPVIRDVSARRNTRIENPSVFPQQGNSGIAQNF